MAFQKKKTRRVRVHQKQDPKNAPGSDAIEMAPNTKKRRRSMAKSAQKARRKSSVPHETTFQVVEGNAVKRKRSRMRSRIAGGVAVVLIATLVVLHFLLPTGLWEWTQNWICTWGGGTMPVTLSGDSVCGLYTRAGRSYVLTDTYMYVYNSSGKEVTAIQHGYSSPVLDVSASRTLLYDRGNYNLRVDTLGSNVAVMEFKQEILTAELSDSGYTAVALNDEEYASTVTVYDRSFTACFKRSFTSESVSCVKLSPDGKTVCIVTVGSNNGALVSNIGLYQVKTGAKLAQETVNGSMLVTALCSDKRLFLSSADDVLSLRWDGSEKKVYDYSGVAFVTGEESGHTLVAYNPDGGREYTVALLDRDGNEKSSFSLMSGFSQICAGKDRVYTLTNNLVEVYGLDGAAADSFEIGYESAYLAPRGRGVVTTSDMQLVYHE